MAKVLVVDDDEQVRVYLSRVLTEAGHEVLLAADGLVATDVCHRQSPVLMIIDLIMPTQEGLATIQQIRREYPNMRILAISGGGMAEPESYLRMARRLGADHVMAKPIMAADLLKIVGELLGQSSTIDQ